MAGFPRMLFKGGIAGAPRLVHDDDEDAQARAEGWLTFGEAPQPPREAPPPVAEAEPTPEPPKRRGRPPKARA